MPSLEVARRIGWESPALPEKGVLTGGYSDTLHPSGGGPGASRMHIQRPRDALPTSIRRELH